MPCMSWYNNYFNKINIVIYFKEESYKYIAIYKAIKSNK